MTVSNIRTMTVFTNRNMNDESLSDSKNEINADGNAELEENLRLGYYAWFSVKRQPEGQGNIYIVYNVSLDTALYLSRKFKPTSFVFLEDGHCQYWQKNGDGKFMKVHEKELCQPSDMTDAEACFTQVSQAFQFKLPFFDGSEENKRTMKETAEYVDSVIRQRTKDSNEARRRIDTTLTATSGYNRYCNRGQLYGNSFHWR